MYDPTRDLYTLFYQWHPQHINWGNISWGYAYSKDLITWTDHNGWQDSEALALGPSGNGSYDGLGIFSGTAQPVNLQGEVDGTWSMFYTSVAYLPTNWQIEYTPYTETQSWFQSQDGGESFYRYYDNPVIDATTETAPMFWNITGFRDPFFEKFPELDEALGMEEPHWYAVFGSGIKGVGPRMPLWAAPENDLTDWTFLGALWEPEANSSFGPILSTRTYAFNFEVSGFFGLPDSKGDTHYFVQMGAEGGNLTYAESSHAALWNEGTISRRENGSAEFTPIAAGLGDWGLSYALTSFNDTKNNRRVQWAWAPEDFVGDDGLFSATQQGFQGAITIPRHLFVHESSELLNDDGVLTENGNAVVTEEDDGTYSAMTLGIAPLPEVVEGLRKGASHQSHDCSSSFTKSSLVSHSGSSSMEIKATVASASGGVGLIVAASPDMQEHTTISYEPSNHTLLVNRMHSSTIVEFNNATITGYFYPYTLASTGAKEHITMDVFLDGSLLEVYINDRFALATRIYPAGSCSTGYGVYVEEGSEAKFEGLEAWVGLKNVWTERPADSSSPLVYDTVEDTNNRTWWPGN